MNRIKKEILPLLGEIDPNDEEVIALVAIGLLEDILILLGKNRPYIQGIELSKVFICSTRGIRKSPKSRYGPPEGICQTNPVGQDAEDAETQKGNTSNIKSFLVFLLQWEISGSSSRQLSRFPCIKDRLYSGIPPNRFILIMSVEVTHTLS